MVFKDPPFEQCLVKDAKPYAVANFKNRWDRFAGKPYGAWLSQCFVDDDVYPRVFAEHTRQDSVVILYFHVNRLAPLSDWAAIADAADTAPGAVDICAWNRMSLPELATMAIGGAQRSQIAAMQNNAKLAEDIIQLVAAHQDSHFSGVAAVSSKTVFNQFWSKDYLLADAFKDKDIREALMPKAARLLRCALLKPEEVETLAGTIGFTKADVAAALKHLAAQGWV